MQTLTLAGGHCVAAFEPQVQALANIQELVLKLLSRSDCNVLNSDGKIRLKRRVFERVSACLPVAPLQRLRDCRYALAKAQGLQAICPERRIPTVALRRFHTSGPYDTASRRACSVRMEKCSERIHASSGLETL